MIFDAPDLWERRDRTSLWELRLYFVLRDGTNLVQNWRKFIDQISDKRHRSTSKFHIYSTNPADMAMRTAEEGYAWGLSVPLYPPYLFTCLFLTVLKCTMDTLWCCNHNQSHSRHICRLLCLNNTTKSLPQIMHCCFRYCAKIFQICLLLFVGVFNQQSKDISSKDTRGTGGPHFSSQLHH